ncbi:ATP-binding protein [Kribbella soli]|uniref:ATP-binding protein n=1 Tax=Kribbella soli TaxID=1124743 RepID=UPI0013F49F48|nr:ATP-binding protein [Kribbella soli]
MTTAGSPNGRPAAKGPASLDEHELVERLEDYGEDDEPLETTLKTDARVIARVTDGIYRQPGSALRELISNAYDADASRVMIRTDRPRFARMSIEDDGVGMSPKALAHLLHHIGGSAKRTASGAELGITSSSDPNSSPGGRPLIGKIGIGLFSVAQLTQSFQIITKVEGDPYRTIARVVLKQYSDVPLSEEDEEQEYEAGQVRLWREPAMDESAQGTTIILDAVRPQTVDTLRSKALWEAVYPPDNNDEEEAGIVARIPAPRFNVGVVQADSSDKLRGSEETYDRLPWTAEDKPLTAFRKLVDAVWQSQREGNPNPRVSSLFDYYLNMVWQLSLWVPLPYVESHPFDVTCGRDVTVLKITNLTGQPTELIEGSNLRIEGKLGNTVESPSDFVVVIDDLELRRPIDVTQRGHTYGAMSTPLLFGAEFRENFESYQREISGGPLAFQAYILWAPKIVPTEHQGVLVRVHDASGTLFDETFMRFPVRETRRLQQISCEIFIVEGFDGALNIDRESFNFSHPHVVLLTKWLHGALKRVIAEQKRRASAALRDRRADSAARTQDAAERIVNAVWNARTDDSGTDPPTIVFSDDESAQTNDNQYLFNRKAVIGEFSGPLARDRQAALERELEQIAQVLAAYGLLDQLPNQDIERLLGSIRQILQVYDQ